METVSSHAFELLHNGQEVLAAFLDVALLFLKLSLLLKHFLLRQDDTMLWQHARLNYLAIKYKQNLKYLKLVHWV